MFSEDFNLFLGEGFAPQPEEGQLNSNAWIVTGLSEGNLNFGDTATSGDFARGTARRAVFTGGVYSFEVESGNNILGIQPTGTGFTPGEIVLKLQNTGESELTEVDVDYNIWSFNDQPRANSLNFSYSSDGTNYITLNELDFTTPEAADASPSWQNEDRSTTITGLTLAPDDFFYLKWTGDDASGSGGSRDQYGIDNVEVSGLSLPNIEPSDPIVAAIYEIQGSGATSPLENQIVTTTGVVTADFRDLNPDDFAPLRGVFIQDTTGDGDIATSDGIFLFLPEPNEFSDFTLDIGDVIEVTGTVTENSPSNSTSDGRTNFTHLDLVTDIEVIGEDTVTPTSITLPETVEGELEQYEGMLITTPEMTVAQTFFVGRYGQLTLASADDNGDAGRPYQPTNQFRPNTPDAIALADENARRILILDDGQDSRRLGDNPDTVPFLGAPPPEVIRAGDTVTDLVGVLDFGRINSSSSNPNLDYRLQVLDTETPTFTNTNPRPETLEDIGGRLKVGSFNVLNYFTSLRQDDSDARGAFDEDELIRQRDKIVAAITTIDADVLGLIEIENNGYGEDSAIQDLVNGLNDVAGEGTYAFVDPGVEQLGTDVITVGFIYKPDNVSPVGDVAVLDKTVDQRFDTDNQRPALAQTFQEIATGETFTVVNNHLKSKGSPPRNLPEGEEPDPRDLDLGDGQGFSNFTRTQAAEALVDWIATDPTNSNDPDVLIVGDLNAYAQEDPIFTLENGGYTNLAEDEAYSFIFDGASGTLDYALVTQSLIDQVTGVTEWHINADEPKVIDYEDFFNPPGYYSPDSFRSSDHDPVIVGLDLATTEEPEPFTLQILHAGDQEGGLNALEDAERFSAVLDALKNQDNDGDGNADYENTVVLGSGDSWIPGVFYDASETAYGAPGRGDILIQNELGFDAIAFGNHEFDQNTGAIREILLADPENNYPGTLFPYLSANLDFSTDENLADLVTADGQEASTIPNSIAKSTVITVNGEQIGVVGATTPTLSSISFPGDVGVNPEDATDVDALAASIQTSVDALTEAGIDKVIALTHMQVIDVELALAEKLTDVDVIIAGGNHLVTVDENDRLRDGDNKQLDYPVFETDAAGDPIAVVNANALYRYVGRLVIDFDANGNIIPESYDSDISGAYATDDQGVADLGGTPDPEITTITDTLEGIIVQQDSNFFGVTDVFLNANRSGGGPDGVRNQETNLGNLTADANLAIAKEFDSDTVISLKNGGGIRANIGSIVTPGGSTEPVRLPPEGNELSGKPDGGISQIDIQNTLAFNNGLTLVTVTAEELLAILEHGIAESTNDDNSAQGRFPQVSGMAFSFDLDLPTGDRIQSLAIQDENGNIVDTVVRDGEIVGDSSRIFRMVTLNFLAGGGDGYPIPQTDRVDLAADDADPRTGVATFAPDGSEQDALAEYLVENFDPTQDANNSPFDQVDVPREGDERIQNLDFREDTVLPDVVEVPQVVSGTPENDDFDTVFSEDFKGDEQILIAGSGDDQVNLTYAEGGNTVQTNSGDDILFAGTNDRIDAGAGDDLLFLGSGGGNNRVTGGSGGDIFYLTQDDELLPANPNTIGDFNASEGDQLGFLATSLAFGSTELNFRQDGANTIITAFGQDVAILNGVNALSLIEDNFVFNS